MSNVQKNQQEKVWIGTRKVCETIKWNRVNLDCWGPKTVKHKDGFTYELRILTMIVLIIQISHCREKSFTLL